MATDDLEGARILLVQSDGAVALGLAEAFAEHGAEVVTTFGLLETFHAIGRNRLDAALVHLDLGDISALPVAVLLHERGIPLAVVTPNRMSAFLARHLPGAVALEPGFAPQAGVSAVRKAVMRRADCSRPVAAPVQAPQRQN